MSIARAVHESNWQEGIYLDEGRTRELTEIAFNDLNAFKGPHLDMDGVITAHRIKVIELRKNKTTVEEVAAYNLSAAHIALNWIRSDIMGRTLALLHKAVYILQEKNADIHERLTPEQYADLKAKLDKAQEAMSELFNSDMPLSFPTVLGEITEGEYYKALSDLKLEELSGIFRIEYIHFLHRITMMGIRSPKDCGSFRKVPVSVGTPDVFFPPPLLVPGLMEEFVKKFPIMSLAGRGDTIMTSAMISYRFVRIHPYIDGNGRISRLIMNLILTSRFPAVHLKADSGGKKKYGYALKRANSHQGDATALACIIAMSLKTIYESILESLGN